ncbi:pheromone-binding protein-like [Vanessa cardui]|uniref:pheromone-binding protein-like n=1 Tax=Vanessa cardui TaxID=171605 RepID=UPI001F142D53|nr:pheromone-binding protein-like [Vanessa cardui]
MAKYFVLVALVLVALGVTEISSNETMRNITASFVRVLDDCKKELNLSDNVLADLYYFWKQDRALAHRDTGCAIVCMSKKLNLLDTTGKLHHGNAQEFAVRHGAGDDMATKLVTTVHECEQRHEVEEDPCVRALEVAKCFKDAMHQIDWAPKIDVIITEVLTEI